MTLIVTPNCRTNLFFTGLKSVVQRSKEIIAFENTKEIVNSFLMSIKAIATTLVQRLTVVRYFAATSGWYRISECTVTQLSPTFSFSSFRRRETDDCFSIPFVRGIRRPLNIKARVPRFELLAARLSGKCLAYKVAPCSLLLLLSLLLLTTFLVNPLHCFFALIAFLPARVYPVSRWSCDIFSNDSSSRGIDNLARHKIGSVFSFDSQRQYFVNRALNYQKLRDSLAVRP